jgi:hypothetical protein
LSDNLSDTLTKVYLENLEGRDYFGGGKMMPKWDLKENGAIGTFRLHKRQRWMKARGLSSRKKERRKESTHGGQK